MAGISVLPNPHRTVESEMPAQSEPADELIRRREKLAENMERINPFPTQPSKRTVPAEFGFEAEAPVDQAEALNSIHSAQLERNAQQVQAFQTIQNLMQTPIVKAYLKVVSHPQVFGSMMEIVKHPRTRNLLYFQLGLLLFFFVFKSWRSARAETTGQRIWVSVYSTLGYWSMAAFVLPALFWGRPYASLLKGIYSAVRAE